MDMFVKNVAAFTDAMGVVNAPIIMHLSMIPWSDDLTRDSFIQELTQFDMSRNN